MLDLNNIFEETSEAKRAEIQEFIQLEAVKKDGAKGTFLNHSEHKLSFSVLKMS